MPTLRLEAIEIARGLHRLGHETVACPHQGPCDMQPARNRLIRSDAKAGKPAKSVVLSGNGCRV